MKKKSLLLTAVTTFLFTVETMAQNVPNYVPTNGLVGWWPFNGNANDLSVNTNNGTVNGATLTTDRFGNTNSAYSFDGNDWIEVLHNSIYNFETQNSITVSLWFLTSLNNGAVFIQKQSGIGSSQNGFNCGILNNLGYLAGISKKTPGIQSLVSSNLNGFNNLLWHNFVYTFNNGNAKLFFDGLEITSQIDNGSIIANSSTNLIFGTGLPLNSAFFNGKLDDIGIWNRALTQQEITDLYNANICYQTITVTDTLLINMGITGFNPITYNNTIKIYPNPTNDHITIDYGNLSMLNGYQLKIDNSLGQQMYQTVINQQSNYINLATWTGNGVYFVHIIDPQGNTVDIRKIVLQ